MCPTGHPAHTKGTPHAHLTCTHTSSTLRARSTHGMVLAVRRMQHGGSHRRPRRVDRKPARQGHGGCPAPCLLCPRAVGTCPCAVSVVSRLLQGTGVWLCFRLTEPEIRHYVCRKTGKEKDKHVRRIQCRFCDFEGMCVCVCCLCAVCVPVPLPLPSPTRCSHGSNVGSV